MKSSEIKIWPAEYQQGAEVSENTQQWFVKAAERNRWDHLFKIWVDLSTGKHRRHAMMAVFAAADSISSDYNWIQILEDTICDKDAISLFLFPLYSTVGVSGTRSPGSLDEGG